MGAEEPIATPALLYRRIQIKLKIILYTFRVNSTRYSGETYKKKGREIGDVARGTRSLHTCSCLLDQIRVSCVRFVEINDGVKAFTGPFLVCPLLFITVNFDTTFLY